LSDDPPWAFGYAPVTPAAGPEPEDARALIVATSAPETPERIAAILGPSARAEVALARAPIFWIRANLAEPRPPAAIARALRAGGVAIRYVASAEHPSLALGEPLDLRGAPVARPDGWAARPRSRAPRPAPSGTAGTWFLRGDEGGVAALPARGGGEGTRLAVIDDDAMEAGALDLDAEVLVGLEAAPRHMTHGSLMVAWASGARGFAGVAPGTSPRLYLIPKPGCDLLALPLAIARAAIDGADVIVCATYVEGSTSPMLDDALELASRLGRRGRGAAVVLPTGREASSAPGSVRASFSLGLGEPASDPRVFCVAPGARGGGWFFWRDRRGRSRPFANRGPAVRWLAPGDDIAYPFSPEGAPERLFHAESSGAAAIAAGVLLLVLAENPSLRLPELAAVVTRTVSPVSPVTPSRHLPLADPGDALPAGIDRDGHNARLGYGLLDAGRACLAASDPICAALIALGEDGAARAFADARRDEPSFSRAYSRRLARWLVRARLVDPEAAEALGVLLRHLRLVGAHEGRRRAHGDGALLRRLRLLLRRCAALRPPPRVAAEVERLTRRLAAVEGEVGQAAWIEQALAEAATLVLSRR
jgi:hypothetical protein